MLDVVQEVSGLRAEVVSQEPQTQEFRFALLDADGQVVGQVLRRHALWDLSRSIFNGSSAGTSGGEYEIHVDTTLTDPRAASRIMQAILKAVPDD